MTKKYKLKTRKTRKYRKYGGTPSRLEKSKINVESIMSRIKSKQDQSRRNMQKMHEYIKRLENSESGPVYDMGQAEQGSPVYDMGRAKSDSPVYDMGRAKSDSPVYDMGRAKSDSPVYDMGQTEQGSPVYDMGQADYDLEEALLQIPNNNIMDILTYNSDSGDRDLATAKTYNKDTPFIEILKKANELKAPLIVKTSYVSEKKPGAWYIKGYNSQFTYEEIKSKIEDNVKSNKYKKRICYLIQYDLGQAEQGSPIYDLGQARPSPELFAKIMKNLADKSKIYSRENLIKLTPENVHQYLGYNILFGTRSQYITKKILGVSKTGKSIQIEHPDLQNSLEIVNRQVYVILKKSPVLGQSESLKPKIYTKKRLIIVKKPLSSPVYDLGQANSSSV